MNFEKKTKLLILISAVLLSLPLFFYRIARIDTKNMNTNITHINREMTNERNNEREVARYIEYKKRLKGKTSGVREEPVDLTAKFVSYKDFNKIGSIIYNTYHKGGSFYLSSFSLAKDKGGKKDSKGITMIIKGKKAVLFW